MKTTTLVLLSLLSLPELSAQESLKIFLLAGQSNMEGQAYTYDNGSTDGWNIPTMEFLLSGSPAATTYLSNLPHTFKDSLNSDWLNPRSDIWCAHYDSSNGSLKEVQPGKDPLNNFVGFGPLSPGFGVGTNFGSMIGAELGMGIRIGDATPDPVFLFKSDKGGTTLAEDWRPPSAVAARGGVVGPHFTTTAEQFTQFLDNLDSDLADDGVLNNSINPTEDAMFGDATTYEICGFAWLQGFNEKVESNGSFIPEYEENLVDLIHDIRSSDSRIPADLPFIVIESSDQDSGLNTGRVNAVATVNSEIAGSAVFHEAENMINGNPGPVFWGNNELEAPFSTGWGFHFHARAENFLEIGWITGGAVLDNNYLTTSSFWATRPEASGVTFNQADVSSRVNEAADAVTIYWGTSDPGATNSGWDGGSTSLGAQAAGEMATTLAGLSEDTTYFFRVHATSPAPATEFWSAPNTFTTPLENPVPELSDPMVVGVFADGASIESTLLLADAGVTMVWAQEDMAESDIPTWTGAPGGGSQGFPDQVADNLISYDITGLDPNTIYFVRFHASNANGSDWSNAVSFTTPRKGVSLTAYYDFEDDGNPYNDPAGDFADDLVGLFNPAVSDDTPGAIAGTQSASFDGNSALFTDAFTSDLGPDPNAFTIMFWVKGEDALQENNNTRLMTTRVLPSGSGSSYNRWQVEGFGNNGSNGDKMDVRMHGDGLPTNWFSPDATNALANNGETPAWHHVAFVLANSGHPDDGGAYGRTFLDGVQVGGIYNAISDYDGIDIANQDGQLIIGGPAENAGSRAFTGLLDDVALFAGVVGDDDIAALAAGTMSPADFLVPSTIVIDSVTVVGPDVLVEFTGAPNSDYKMTESVDLISKFTDTSPLAETTTDGSGKGTIMWPLAGDGKFGRVEKK